jgi:predicted nucleic acid-binding protein
MHPAIYIETTIPSYLAAWQSPQIVMAARQQITRDWWDNDRQNYELFISQVVLNEAAAGDPVAASKRIEIVRDVKVLEPPTEVDRIVDALMRQLPLPPNAATDALHIAYAIGHGVDYLLTWNCRHIANATLHTRMESICESLGFDLPTICTPEQLIEV